VSETQEKNKALVRRFFEAQEKGDLNAVKEMMAPNFVDHSLRPGQDSGREGYLQAAAEDLASFSEVHHIFEEQLADGDKVISRITISATHDRGEVIGLMPTGKTYEVTYIHIHRIEGGKIVEEWCEGSGLAVLAQEQLERERIERERVEQELRVARHIQQASLPKEVACILYLGNWVNKGERAPPLEL
jgi:predicted ester cyclase